MKADRKRLKGEKTDLVSQMQQLYATLESREEQLRDFIRNYEQHRKVSASPAPALSCSPLPSPLRHTQSSFLLLAKHGPCLESQSTLGGSAVCFQSGHSRSQPSSRAVSLGGQAWTAWTWESSCFRSLFPWTLDLTLEPQFPLLW